MQTPTKSNEHGFALVLELVVLALVVSALGFGFYQYHQHSQSAASLKAPVTAVGTAADVNTSLEKAAAVEETDSTSADSLGDELNAADSASADVEGGIDENSF